MTALHPVVDGVTQRIRERSAATRSAYLQGVDALRHRAPGPDRLGCANVAHAFAALPKDIQDLVDERLRADFLLVLDPSKGEGDEKKVLDFVEDYNAKGNAPATQFLEALAKATPLKFHVTHG